MKALASILMCMSALVAPSQELDISLYTTGLDRPVNIKHANDSRLFVVEQDGLIQIINDTGTIESQPFLDITTKVYNVGSIGDERGMLGLAFHPDYDSNGYFYVNYIDNSGDTVISRFTRDAIDPSVADPNSELIILTISQPFSNHNGGDMAFGPDNYLYIATGDGGSGGDPFDNGQDINNLLGKILRIDVDNTTGTVNYAIPNDNPFVGVANAKEEIWVYGIRNPWKFSFDKMNHDLWIADVGQKEIEEIDLIPTGTSGQNLGWRCYEGSTIYNNSGCPPIGELTFPVAEYSHSASGAFKCSITGGYRYRGTTYPNFEGLYFFADYCSQEIGYLTYNGSSWDMSFKDFPGNSWTAFGEDINGELYATAINSGNIYRLVDTSLSVTEQSFSSINLYPNPSKQELFIDFSTISSSSIDNIEIFDIGGKFILNFKPNNQIIQKIDVSEFASGYYLVKIKSKSSEIMVKKLIIN